jgi:hypothetical protein
MTSQTPDTLPNISLTKKTNELKNDDPLYLLNLGTGPFVESINTLVSFQSS